MKDRCGAKGVVIRRPEGVGVEVFSLISEVKINNLTISLPEDLSVGMFVPMENLAREHRGLVIIADDEKYLDEGELWLGSDANAHDLVFVSDDDGPFADTPIESLVGKRVKIKPEIFDQLNAFRRLRGFKKVFPEGTE